VFGEKIQVDMAGFKGVGEAGEQKVEMKFCCAAEDKFFTEDTVGKAGMRIYRDVKAGALKGAPEIALNQRALCTLVVFRDGTKEATFKQVTASRLSFSLSKKPETPPTVNLFIVHGWSGDKDLQSVGLAYKQTLTIEVTAVEGDLFAKPSKSPAVKKKDAQTEL
jgi:hypothetical protein